MIRPYQKKDDQQLIELIRLNIPLYFAESEEADFKEYLEKYTENYFVIEVEEKIIGAGGFNFVEEQKFVRISWDTIHPDFHGKGFGKQLTQYRIEQIKKNPIMEFIEVRTSQLAYPFYQKMGFKLDKIEKDYWAKGLDLYKMHQAIAKGIF